MLDKLQCRLAVLSFEYNCAISFLVKYIGCLCIIPNIFSHKYQISFNHKLIKPLQMSELSDVPAESSEEGLI